MTERQNGTPAAVANVRTSFKVRADKLSQLNQSLRKSVRVKEYKQSSQENIKEWLSKYEDEMYGLARGVCKLNLTENDLTDIEYVDLVRCKLEFVITQELDQ